MGVSDGSVARSSVMESNGMSTLGLKNWSGNLEYKAKKLHEPSSISEAGSLRQSCHEATKGQTE